MVSAQTIQIILLYRYGGVMGLQRLRCRVEVSGGGCTTGTTTMLSINVFIYMLMQKGRRRPGATKERLGRGARRFSANLTSFRAGNHSSTHPIVTEVASVRWRRRRRRRRRRQPSPRKYIIYIYYNIKSYIIS